MYRRSHLHALNVWYLLLALSVAGCAGKPPELRVFPLSYQNLDPERMEAIFEGRSGVRMKLAQPAPGMSGLQALVSDQADLTLLENSTPFVVGVRAILPVHKSVLHLLVREGFDLDPALKPLGRARIYVANESYTGRDFVRIAARRQGIGESQLKFVNEVDDATDLIVYFGPVAPLNTGWYRPGYRLYSLDQNAGESSDALGGLSYLVPKATPAIIPARTYDLPGNERPIATMQVDMLLAARKEIPERLAYEVTRTLIEQKQRFMAISPAAFSGINESFDPLDLNFPLHPGARRYLHRDEPTLLERYAETINMLVYLSVLALTGLIAAARWRARRKKNRADVFYERVFAVRARANDEPPEKLLEELDALEKEAFALLIDEKLAADDSFRIFMDLMSRTREGLRDRVSSREV